MSDEDDEHEQQLEDLEPARTESEEVKGGSFLQQAANTSIQSTGQALSNIARKQ